MDACIMIIIYIYHQQYNVNMHHHIIYMYNN